MYNRVLFVERSGELRILARLSTCLLYTSGSGSQAYTFIWGMVGENQDFDDMDGVDMKDLM